MRKNRFLQGFLFYAVAISIIFCIKTCVDIQSNNMFRKESKITFRGTVYSKHKAKGTILEIETNDNEMITVDNPSCELDRFVLVYDSIVKLNEQNICIVKRDSTQKTMHYLYDGVRGGVTDCY